MPRRWGGEEWCVECCYVHTHRELHALRHPHTHWPFPTFTFICMYTSSTCVLWQAHYIHMFINVYMRAHTHTHTYIPIQYTYVDRRRRSRRCRPWHRCASPSSHEPTLLKPSRLRLVYIYILYVYVCVRGYIHIWVLVRDICLQHVYRMCARTHIRRVLSLGSKLLPLVERGCEREGG